MAGLISKALTYGIGNSQPIVMSDVLKIIDEAPALATIDFGSWSMVFKKVDELPKNTYQKARSGNASNDWQTHKIQSYAMMCICVYCGTTLKWISNPKYLWALSTDYYKFGSLGGEQIHWKYYQVRWGIATGDSDDDTTFTENVIRITDVQPLLPSKTSTAVTVGMKVTWLYDEQIINYNYDGTIDNLRYNRNLTNDTGYSYVNDIELCFVANADVENLEKDYSAFCEAVMAYVSK